MGGVRDSGHRRGARGVGRALRGTAIVLGALALGPVLLAACGSTPAPSSPGAPTASASSGAAGSPNASASPGAAAGPLCQNTASVTGLRIVRVPGIRVPQEQGVVPGQVVVTSPARAREVARALCALPLMPHGVLNCPAMYPGTSYELLFTADGRRFAPVTIDATGCETVTGAGPVRRALDPGFWRVLSVAAGITPAGRLPFACAPPKSGVKINGCPGLMQPGGAAQSGTGSVS
jgi:hypothetical protein